jgi:hypothetical protein
VPQPILQQCLVKIESLDGVCLGVRVLRKQFKHQRTRLVLLLDKTKDLVNLVRNDVSVLVYLVFRCLLAVPIRERMIILVNARRLHPSRGLPAPPALTFSDVIHILVLHLWIRYLLLLQSAHRGHSA